MPVDIPIELIGGVLIALVFSFIGWRLGSRRQVSRAKKQWNSAVERLTAMLSEAEQMIGDRYLNGDDLSFVTKDLTDAKGELAQLTEKVGDGVRDWDECVRLALNVYGRCDRVKDLAGTRPSKTQVAVPAPRQSAAPVVEQPAEKTDRTEPEAPSGDDSADGSSGS